MLETHLGNWEPALPADVWGNIENAMANSSKRKAAAWYIGVAAAAALAVFATFKVFNNKEVNVNVIWPAETEETNGVKNKPSVSAFEGDEATKSATLNPPTTATKNNNTSLKYKANSTNYNQDAVKAANSSATNGVAANAYNNKANVIAAGDEPNIGLLYNSLPPVLKEAELYTATAPMAGSIAWPFAAANITSVNAFPIAKNKLNLSIKTAKPASHFVGVNVLTMNNNLGYSTTSNPYVHRDFAGLHKNNRTVSSFELEIFGGKHIANSWYATAGLRMGQQGSQANYDFNRVPVGLDNTLNTDKFGYYPIVAYFNAFASQAKFSTQQKTTVLEMPFGVLKQLNLNKNYALLVAGNVAPGMAISNVGTTLNYNDLSPVSVNNSWYRKVLVSNALSLGVVKHTNLGDLGLNLKGRIYPVSVYKTGASIKQKPYDIGVGILWTGGLTK